jgi:hypothetical protein
MNKDVPEYTALLHSAVAYLKEYALPLFCTKEEYTSFAPKKAHKPIIQAIQTVSVPKQTIPAKAIPQAPPEEPKIYRKDLKNREFDEEAPQNSDLERATIVRAQGASEGQNFEEKPTQSKTDSSSSFGIKPAAIVPSKPKDDGAIKNFLQRISFALSERIPDDAAATRKMHAYKEYLGTVDVILFLCDEDPDTLALMKNLSKSIDQKLGPARMLRPDRLEREGRWDLFLSKNRVKLFIASCGFAQCTQAMTHFRQTGSAMTLSGIPLIVLQSAAAYLQAPKEKMVVWNQLCALLKP